MKATLYTDGGARGNPGPAAAGIVIKGKNKKNLWAKGYFLGRLTNNQAEYQALLKGLKKAASLNVSELKVILDSELIVKQMSGEYRVKNQGLKPLFAEVCRLVDRFKKVEFEHTLRAGNKEADKLLNQVLDRRGK